MKIEIGDLINHPAVPGFAGALLGLKALPGATIIERACNVAAGFGIAMFAGPALVETMDISSAKIQAGVVFGVGAAGLVIFGALIDAVRKTDIAEWIMSWLPRRGGRE